jgi:hypothetical protein
MPDGRLDEQVRVLSGQPLPGHFVPEMQGSRALYMITQFLAGAKL